MSRTINRAARALAAVPAEPAPVPVPTALVHQVWFPASVMIPSEGRQRNNVKVFATDAGLYVYDAVPVDAAQDTEPTPLFHSPIQFDKTRKPPTGMAASNGVHIVTEAGTVTVMATGGCGCGYRALRNWLPTWGTAAMAWPDPA